MKICKFCSKDCKNDNSLRNHERLCPLNLERKYVNGMTGKKGHNQYTKAKKLGLPKPILSVETRKKLAKAGANKILSDEQKANLSKIKIQFLKENPDKVPYRLNHHSKGPSYPERYWEDVLINNGVIFEKQYPIAQYQLDFAILSAKIDLEIDGEQHYVDKRIAASDIRRTKFLENLGWTTIRIRWSEYLKLENKQEFVNIIINNLKMDR